jgi:galactokinase
MKTVGIQMNDLFTLDAVPMLPSDMLVALRQDNPRLDNYLANDIYVNSKPDYLNQQKERYIATLEMHLKWVGDRPTYLLRAPGRLNAFLEYLDMCAGDHMSTTIDGDILVAFSPSEDDTVRLVNANPLFPSADFSICREVERFKSAPWSGSLVGDLLDNWDNRTRVYPYYGRTQGDWVNYVLSPYLRMAWELPDILFRGGYVTFGPSTAPFRAGTSSSSAVVVLSMLCLYLANRDHLPPFTIPEICRLLGEAEWYVGTHGGANDQTTILLSQPNGVLYNRHSQPVLSSTTLPCLKGIRVVLANSLWEANKALGANHVFNLRKGWMDLGDHLMVMIIDSVRNYLSSVGSLLGENFYSEKRLKPGWLANLLQERFGFVVKTVPRLLESDVSLWGAISANYNKFGSLVEDLLGIPDSAIAELINLLPEEISPEVAGRLLKKDLCAMERDYTLPYPHEGGYKVRNAAIFFYKENQIGRTLERIFLEADNRLKSSEITESSPAYDEYRVYLGRLVEQLQDTLRDDFQVSNSQLDMLLDIARRGPGYLGGKLTGAGSGGCVSIIVREGYEDAFCQYLDSEYYGKLENFSQYVEVLNKLESDSPPGSPEHKAALEMKSNLENALANVQNQRRPVTFSRGACAVRLDLFM